MSSVSEIQIESPTLALLNRLNIVDEYSDNRRLAALFEEKIPRNLSPYAGCFVHGALNDLFVERIVPPERLLHPQHIEVFGQNIGAQIDAMWGPNYDHAAAVTAHTRKAEKIVSDEKVLKI